MGEEEEGGGQSNCQANWHWHWLRWDLIYQHVSRAAQESLALSAQLGTQCVEGGRSGWGRGRGGGWGNHTNTTFSFYASPHRNVRATRAAVAFATAELTLFRQVQQAEETEELVVRWGGLRGSVRGFIKILISTAPSLASSDSDSESEQRPQPSKKSVCKVFFVPFVPTLRSKRKLGNAEQQLRMSTHKQSRRGGVGQTATRSWARSPEPEPALSCLNVCVRK